MRIDYQHPAASRVKIYLNGRDVTNTVTEADEEGGWVEIVVLDVNRHPIWDFRRNMPVTVRVEGKVQIELPKWRCTRCGWVFDTAVSWAHHLRVPHIVEN
ncbi:hypothetical protein KC887_02820 [Candidatus Kaiserbacteria bacterium]|nr:hypothetical protein [Candidatus Kaiserbacteria bacterium]